MGYTESGRRNCYVVGFLYPLVFFPQPQWYSFHRHILQGSYCAEFSVYDNTHIRAHGELGKRWETALEYSFLVSYQTRIESSSFVRKITLTGPERVLGWLDKHVMSQSVSATRVKAVSATAGVSSSSPYNYHSPRVILNAIIIFLTKYQSNKKGEKNGPFVSIPASFGLFWKRLHPCPWLWFRVRVCRKGKKTTENGLWYVIPCQRRVPQSIRVFRLFFWSYRFVGRLLIDYDFEGHRNTNTSENDDVMDVDIEVMYPNPNDIRQQTSVNEVDLNKNAHLKGRRRFMADLEDLKGEKNTGLVRLGFRAESRSFHPPPQAIYYEPTRYHILGIQAGDDEGSIELTIRSGQGEHILSINLLISGEIWYLHL